MTSDVSSTADIRGTADAATESALLAVKGLAVAMRGKNGLTSLTEDVCLTVHAGRTLGVAGESGSGKSMTAAAILGLLPPGAEIVSGSISWQGHEINQADMEILRGRQITLINQEPTASLDSLTTIGAQLTDILVTHLSMSKRSARARAAELLDLVGIANAGRCLDQYVWQLSGGMAQRVVIAMAIAPEPELIIADEPTTAVDVTIQAQILAELMKIQQEMRVGVMLITHDLGVLSGIAHDVAVMYAGRTVETGPTSRVFRDPRHPYSSALLAATPDPGRPRVDRLPEIPGSPPAELRTPGCAFRARCSHTTDACASSPELTPVTAEADVTQERKVACWNA